MSDSEPTRPIAKEARESVISRLKDWAPSKGQLAVAAIAILSLSNVACWIQLSRNDPPRIMTVGVREMTQNYIASLALSDITPEEAGVRTDLFLSVTKDTLERAGRDRNVLLLARECVLAGTYDDVTSEVGEAVKSAMARAGAPQASPAGPPVATSVQSAQNGALGG